MKKILILVLIICASLGVIAFVWGVTSSECCSLFSNTEENMGVQHRNAEYGFSFDLPDSWRGYLIVTSTWEGRSVESGEVVVTGPMVLIRHPLWTKNIPRQDIPVMVFTEKEWNEVLAGKLSLGAAPIPPSELGRNEEYIFALPARYNYAFPEGFEEVEEILNTNPLGGI